MIWNYTWYEILIMLPVIAFTLSMHGMMKGYAALWLGDPTAKHQGRLTLNPVAHFDLFGFIAMIIAPIGWSKPVETNARNFKKRRRDEALVALAGPLSNIIVAFISALILITVVNRMPDSLTVALIKVFLSMMMTYNLGIAVFNLLPIPPLDGSKIFLAIMPASVRSVIYKFEEYGIFFLLLVIYLLRPVISAVMMLLLDIFEKIIKLLPF